MHTASVIYEEMNVQTSAGEEFDSCQQLPGNTCPLMTSVQRKHQCSVRYRGRQLQCLSSQASYNGKETEDSVKVRSLIQ